MSDRFPAIHADAPGSTLKRRMLAILALVTLSAAPSGCSPVPFECPEPEVTVDGSVHDETGPIARELRPLGQITEVHWVEWTESGRCDFSVGDLILLREGVARIAPADLARLTKLTMPETGERPGENSPDARLVSWLPSVPNWRTVADLDWRDGEEGFFVSTSYWLDPDSGTILFRSDADYDPATPSVNSQR